MKIPIDLKKFLRTALTHMEGGVEAEESIFLAASELYPGYAEDVTEKVIYELFKLDPEGATEFADLIRMLLTAVENSARPGVIELETAEEKPLHLSPDIRAGAVYNHSSLENHTLNPESVSWKLILILTAAAVLLYWKIK
ncbi:MAG: hypothetical protein ABIG11_06715 [bacterium]